MSANSVDTVTISADGKYIDKEKLTPRQQLPDGNIEIITEQQGIDGNENKPALIRFTYIFGKTMFNNRKDVQFTGEQNWIKRHEHSYKKIASYNFMKDSCCA